MKSSKISKLTITMLLSVFYFCNVFAADLYVHDPRGWWGSRQQGKITEAVLSVKPKGAFMEYGLYLTIGPSTPRAATDTFEIVMNFDLPKEAFIHDSWLWVENQIVQAELLDRWTATNIYEGIVQRRQDPSLLYKNSDTNYDIKIFPLEGNSTRKIKITYLTPVDFSKHYVTASLPFNILKLSSQVPNFRIQAYTNAVWNSPEIVGSINTNFVYNALSDVHVCTLPSSAITNNATAYIQFRSPLTNGYYLEKYETAPDEGFYQFIAIPDEFVNAQIRKNILFVIDHKASNYSLSQVGFLSDLKSAMKNFLSEGDSFGLVYATPNVRRYSSVWIAADSLNIESAISTIEQSPPLHFNTSSLLIHALDFIGDNNYNGNILFITTGDQINAYNASNNLISDLQMLANSGNIKIDVLSYQDKGFSSAWWHQGNYYYGNEYFNQRLAHVFGGNYLQLYERPGTNSYYGQITMVRNFSNALSEMLMMASGKINDFDLHTTVSNGFCYGRYNVNTGISAFLKKPIIQFGKYIGNDPFEATISGRINSNIITNNIQINNPHNFQDTLVKKMWVNSFITALEKQSPNNQTVREIIDSSINNRVLCRYTAFLALEPNDTISACETCPDETNINSPALTTVESILNRYTINAQPNPFSNKIIISISGEKLNENNVEIVVFDMLGREIKKLKVISEDNKITATWNGADEYDAEVDAGIYIAIIKTPTGNITRKIVKQ